ncbi:MAG: peroxiredoxin [Bacteroidota bacterium]
MEIKVGDHAPDFTLTSDTKAEISLSDYKGKNVVVLFFPLAFTGVCTTELCTMRDDLSTYGDLNAQVLAISVDSPFTLEEFKKAQQYNFPLLSDFNKEVSSDYGSLYENFVFGMKGVSKRSAFVIDKEGIVRYAEVLENAGEEPNYEDIKATLSRLN